MPWYRRSVVMPWRLLCFECCRRPVRMGAYIQYSVKTLMRSVPAWVVIYRCIRTSCCCICIPLSSSLQTRHSIRVLAVNIYLPHSLRWSWIMNDWVVLYVLWLSDTATWSLTTRTGFIHLLLAWLDVYSMLVCTYMSSVSESIWLSVCSIEDRGLFAADIGKLQTEVWRGTERVFRGHMAPRWHL